MHSSLVILTLISSVFTAPLPGKEGDVVNAPIDIKAPVDAIVAAAIKAAVPVKAAVGNVDAKYINVANGILSGNDLDLRDVVNIPVDVKAPIKAIGNVVAEVKAPVDAAVANVKLDKINAANAIGSGNDIDLRDVVNAPANVFAPVDAVVKAAAKVVAPVYADVANVQAEDIKAANDILSGNDINLRDVVNAPANVKAPVDALVKAAAEVFAPVYADVANVKAEKINAANVIGSGNDIDLRDVVNAPANVFAPVDAVVKAAAKVAAPVYADVANVQAEYINAANGILSGNKLDARGGDKGNVVNLPVDIKAPVDVLAAVYADVFAPVKAAVGNVDVKNANIANGILSGNDIKAT